MLVPNTTGQAGQEINPVISVCRPITSRKPVGLSELVSNWQVVFLLQETIPGAAAPMSAHWRLGSMISRQASKEKYPQDSRVPVCKFLFNLWDKNYLRGFRINCLNSTITPRDHVQGSDNGLCLFHRFYWVLLCIRRLKPFLCQGIMFQG
jgi:hypothetical protein